MYPNPKKQLCSSVHPSPSQGIDAIHCRQPERDSLKDTTNANFLPYNTYHNNGYGHISLNTKISKTQSNNCFGTNFHHQMGT